VAGVWLVRHGATTAPANVTIGSSDPPLSLEGRDQAKALAVQLAHRRPVRIFASDARRAVATAEAIAAVHGLRVQVDRRLRELDFGDWEGRRLAELWEEEAEAAAAWERDLRASPPSFGERVDQLEGRLRDFWAECEPRARDEVVIVAHRGSLAVLRALISGITLETSFAAGMPVGHATLVIPRPA
jgi:broad specificity phosphatase PhoE